MTSPKRKFTLNRINVWNVQIQHTAEWSMCALLLLNTLGYIVIIYFCSTMCYLFMGERGRKRQIERDREVARSREIEIEIERDKER